MGEKERVAATACSITAGISAITGAARGVGKHQQPGRGLTKVSLAADDRNLPSSPPPRSGQRASRKTQDSGFASAGISAY